MLFVVLAHPLQATQPKANKGKTPGAWFNLAQQGELSLLKELYEYFDIDINAKDADGRTALHWSAYNGHLGCVKYLLSKGADVNATDRYKQTVLSICIRNAKEGKRWNDSYVGCIECLLQYGADIHHLFSYYEHFLPVFLHFFSSGCG